MRGRRIPSRPAAVALAAITLACTALAASAQVVHDVHVERVRPQREKRPTLRFLKENRDFIRARFDLLRTEPRDGRAGGNEVDPRILDYQAMLRDVLAVRDSVSAAEEMRRRQQLLQSINDLGRLESELDLIERQLAAQRVRLGVLQEDFTGEQQTALVVVLTGYPGQATVSDVAVTLEDGAPLRVTLTPEQQESLRHGGVVQVFHRFVEPRDQVVEVSLGDATAPGAPGFVTLEPPRDRLTFLRLDLSGVGADRAAEGIRAGTWLHDSRLPGRDG